MKLIVHIGAGKTGSTAIQNVCDAERATLHAQGIAYLGCTLEHCATRSPFNWQRRSGAQELLHDTDPSIAQDQIHLVLKEELELLSNLGFRAAIWSNEALFKRNEGVIPALQRLDPEKVNLEIVVYLRRHDAWARSAYTQWGIRHKSYRGTVKSFQQWIEERPPKFANSLAKWHECLGNNLKPLNYDRVEDTVSDFLVIAGAEQVSTARALPSPGTTELAVWAIYNSQYEREMLPGAFRSFLDASGMTQQAVPRVAPPQDLFPDADAIETLRVACFDDLNHVNQILEAYSEQPLSFDGELPAQDAPDSWEMIKYLMVLNFSLQDQVNALCKRLDDLGG